MAEEGHGSVILTPEQRAQYERQQAEWRRKREEDAKQENDRKIENDQKRQEDETTFGFPIIDTSAILGEEVKMKNIPPSVLPNFYGMSTEDPDSFMFEFDILCRTYGYTCLLYTSDAADDWLVV